jgi:hypothetical protein
MTQLFLFFVETEAVSKKPMGNTAFLNLPKVEVKSGETKEIIVTSEGQIAIL